MGKEVLSFYGFGLHFYTAALTFSYAYITDLIFYIMHTLLFNYLLLLSLLQINSLEIDNISATEIRTITHFIDDVCES